MDHIFTTLRYDTALREIIVNAAASKGALSAIYLREYHFDRLREAVAATAQDGNTEYLDSVLSSPESLENAIASALMNKTEPGFRSQSEPHGPFRIRFALYHDGSTQVQCQQMPHTTANLFPTSLGLDAKPTWTVCLDIQPTERSAHTSFKTSTRQAYDRARQAAECTPAASKEVLLYNNDRQIMDASITTPYFHRDCRWVTPPASAGGQQGTTRRWALANGICLEQDVPLDTLREGEIVWLSNAARGFFSARLCLSTGKNAPPS